MYESLPQFLLCASLTQGYHILVTIIIIYLLTSCQGIPTGGCGMQLWLLTIITAKKGFYKVVYIVQVQIKRDHITDYVLAWLLVPGASFCYCKQIHLRYQLPWVLLTKCMKKTHLGCIRAFGHPQVPYPKLLNEFRWNLVIRVSLMLKCFVRIYWVERKVFAFSKRWRKQTKKFLQGRNWKARDTLGDGNSKQWKLYNWLNIVNTFKKMIDFSFKKKQKLSVQHNNFGSHKYNNTTVSCKAQTKHLRYPQKRPIVQEIDTRYKCSSLSVLRVS
jgi:hypothetical protein